MRSSSENGRLSGKTLIWTGSQGSGDAIIPALETAGASVKRHPLIETRSMSLSPAETARLKRMPSYDWVIFSSAKAVRHLPGQLSLSGVNIAAVGPATAAAIETRGGNAALLPTHHNAAALAERLKGEHRKGECLLFVQGKETLPTIPETLRQAGIAIETVSVYQTVPVDADDRSKAVSTLENADGIIMGSPSGVSALAEAVRPTRLVELHLTWFCLGKTTRDALAEHGVTARFPERITPEDVVSMIAGHF